MSEFKPGDVVMLRCGGPMMVVARLDEPRPTPPANAGWGDGDLDPYRPGHVFVCWTVQGASRWERYPAAALRLADADEATEAAPKPRLVKGGR
jgi:hypothetical protein